MSDLLSKPIVLVLNGNWQRTAYTTVGKAIVALTGGIHTPPALVVDVVRNEDGSFSPGIAYKWDDWIKLPVEPHHLAISTTSGAIRCPLVLLEASYKQMPLKAPKLTTRGILERDGFRDQYTGERLTPEEASVDHVIPKHVWKTRGLKGSPNSWENMVACHKRRNHNKGCKTNGSMGMVLTKKPRAPKQLPIHFFIKEPKLREHTPFFES